MKMKKVLAVLLAATMVIGTGQISLAAGSGSAAPAKSSASTESNAGSNSAAAENGSPTSNSSVAVVDTVKGAGATVSLAGTNVKTTVAGAYAAAKVQGVAITDSLDSVKANLSLNKNQTPYIMVFDTDAKKSYKAMNCINAAVDALGGGKIAATLNVDIRAKENGKFVKLTNGSVGLVVGLPKGVDTTKPISIVCVRPGGATTILKDTDSNPKTVTFEVQAGLGTYAIVTK